MVSRRLGVILERRPGLERFPHQFARNRLITQSPVKQRNFGCRDQIDSLSESVSDRNRFQLVHDCRSDATALMRRSDHDIDSEAVHRRVAYKSPHRNHLAAFNGAH